MNPRTTIISTGKERGRPARNTFQFHMWAVIIQISKSEKEMFKSLEGRQMGNLQIHKNPQEVPAGLWNTGVDQEWLHIWSNWNSKTQWPSRALGNWLIHERTFTGREVVILELLLTWDCWVIWMQTKILGEKSLCLSPLKLHDWSSFQRDVGDLVKVFWPLGRIQQRMEGKWETCNHAEYSISGKCVPVSPPGERENFFQVRPVRSLLLHQD